MPCFDTMILIWGLRFTLPPQSLAKMTPDERRHHELMTARTKRYLEFLGHEGKQIMIPAIVLAEFLTGEPRTNHERLIASMQRNFFVPAFDIDCAAVLAELMSNKKLISQIKSENMIQHQCLKADAMIIASAIVHGATEIITDNVKHYKKLAQSRITVSEIPVIEVQSEMFKHGV